MPDNNRRVQIDHDSSVPVYQQIADIIRERIHRGALTGVEAEDSYPPGKRIPSLRRMWEETGADVKTIQHAVRVLAAEGLVEVSKHGKGTFVIGQSP